MSEPDLSEAKKCFSYMFILIELSKGKKLTGYDISVQMREFGLNVSPGTIYHRLGILSKRRIVKEERQPWGKNYKTVYEMTQKGKEIFQRFKKNWGKPLEYAYMNLKS